MPGSETASAAWTLEGGFYREGRLRALGIAHGVSTAAWGDMKDPGARRAALAALGLGGRRPLWLRQRHGTQVHEASVGTPADPEGDGWVCADRGAAACVYVADCLPLFVWDARGTAVGVFHAGWRGLASGMPRAAVRAFRRYGLGPERLAAAMGPHIGLCCYRVGEELAARLRPGALAARGGESFLDLAEEARRQLLESGVAPEALTVSDACTACRAGEFFSYRRDKTDRRLMACIGP